MNRGGTTQNEDEMLESKEKRTYLCGGEREKPEHSAAGEVLMIITTTLAMDIYRYAPADVTLPFVSCQVPVKLIKTSRLSFSICSQLKWASESMPSMCIANRAGEVGLIVSTTSNL